MKEKTNQWQEEGESFCVSLPLVLCSCAGQEAQGPLVFGEAASFSLFVPLCFSVSRCLAEPCVSIDLASCKRTVADGQD